MNNPQNPHPGGLYNLKCLQCCASLILSTQPLKPQAAAMLRVIERAPESPGRAQVLECVRHAMAKPP